jgi:hypothetical protein
MKGKKKQVNEAGVVKDDGEIPSVLPQKNPLEGRPYSFQVREILTVIMTTYSVGGAQSLKTAAGCGSMQYS